MVERAPKPFQSFKELQYKRHRPDESVLYKLIQENLETFLERFQLEMGHPLPAFVTKEFYDYLDCGILANGFLRVQCEKCHHENLVAFSCKHRGFCPSCGARRMVETAAHLVDYVLPDQPIRQFVLTFPFQLRPLLAVRPKIMSACLEISHRATTAFLLKKAGLSKTTGVTGGVTLIQRFGGACNVNVHLHQLLIDGAYELNTDKIPEDFHKSAPPTIPELEGLVKTIAHRVAKYLEKNGIIAKDDDAPLQLNIPMEEGFSHLQAASSSYRFLLGPNKGKKALVLKSQVDRDHLGKGGLVGKYSGFTLHGGVAVGPGQRDKLEKIARYIARPAISEERLSVNSRGQVIYKLKTPYDDGTTQIVFEPLEFMEKLAALVPRPRVHLTRFHGVLAPNYKYRKLIVPTPLATTPNQGAVDQSQDDNIKNDSTKKKRITWAQLLKRVFKMDMETCNVCGGKMAVISAITDPEVIQKILEHLKLPTRSPKIHPSRGPPQHHCKGSGDDFIQAFPDYD
jgi:hypothetical protein